MRGFNKNDKVTINPKCKESILKNWFDKWLYKPMTIKSFRIDFYIDSMVEVYENPALWPVKHLIHWDDDFIEENEFKI